MVNNSHLKGNASDSMKKPKLQAKKKTTKVARGSKKKGPRFSREARERARGCVDPFSDCAAGCKMMSEENQRTFTYTSLGRSTLTTNASGAAGKWFHPGLKKHLASGTVVGADIPTWGTAVDLPEVASIDSIAGKYRIVCAGLHVFSSCSSNEAKGIVMVSTGTGTVPQPGYNVDSMLYDEVVSDSLLGFDKVFIFKRLATAQVGHYEPVVSTLPHEGWDSITVTVTGCAASTNVLGFEWIYHMELLPDPITIGARVADPPPVIPPGAAQLMSAAAKKLPFGADSSAWSGIVDKVFNMDNLLLAGELALAIL